MTDTLTKEQIEEARQYFTDAVIDDPLCSSHYIETVDALCDLALEALEMRPWNGATAIPPVEEGGMGYFLVVTEKSKTAFGAYYLNNYPLQYEDDCPDATKENGWTVCKGCEDGDGHPSTGWFDEQKEQGYRDIYYAMDKNGEYAVRLWASPPPNPLSSLPKVKQP